MTKAEIANGSGVRVALWVSGCTHHCENCQNPETWDCKAGKLFEHSDLIRLLNELSLPYYDGLTLTGGDPMHPMNRDMIPTRIIDDRISLSDSTISCLQKILHFSGFLNTSFMNSM